MTIGSPEWMEQQSKELVSASLDELDAICLTATKDNNIASLNLNQKRMISVAMFGTQIQTKSFALGVKMGMELVLKGIRRERSNAGQGS